MEQTDTADYYSRRERQERRCAARAGDPAAAVIHEAMAERYAVLIGQTRHDDSGLAEASAPC